MAGQRISGTGWIVGAKGESVINSKNIALVEAEMQRLNMAIVELKSAWSTHDHKEYSWQCPKQTGAVRRASMDLTRALAVLRRS